MQEIIIDEEFQRLFPPLDERQFCNLEENILTYGCMNPLVLWNNILIDGHNRYNIVTKHNLPFNTISLEFNSRDKAMAWMIKLQIDRRNLTPMQLTYYRGMHYNIEKKLHGDIERVKQQSASGQNDHLQGSTANRLSEQYNISPRTIRRDGEIADVIIAIGKESMETKSSILSGKTQISRKQLHELAAGTGDDVTRVVEQIQEGTFQGGRRSASTSDGGTNNDGADSADMQPWEREFGKMTEDFRQKLRGLAKTDDTASVRDALKSYITMLEELYEQI